MKRMRTTLCAVAFGLLYGITLALALYFTADTPLLAGHLDWERCEIVGGAGRARSFDESVPPPELEAGEQFRFTARLPALDEAPELYEAGTFMLTEISGAMRITLNGREIFACAAPDHGQNTALEQVRLNLGPADAGAELALYCTPDGAPNLFPPFLRFTGEDRLNAVNASIVHSYAIPAGAYILAFLIVAALFLSGIAAGTPDWSLPALALAELTAAACLMCQNAGAYYLPAPVYAALGGSGTVLVPIALMLLYLALNRRRRFWRYLGRITLCAAAVLLVLCLPFWRTAALLRATLVDLVQKTWQGNWNALLKWGLTYLTAACSAIAVYGQLKAQAALQNEKIALSLQNDLALQNYSLIRRSVQDTAQLRHEWKNNVAALQLLAGQGDLAQLRARLEQMGSALDRLSVKSYSRNLAIDAILRNAAARAEEQGIRFSAGAPVPEQLAVDITDLCSFLFNLLDNALEAASHAAPGRREVECNIRYNQGYLAVMCRNTYAGPLAVDEEGNLNTTKPGRNGAGFGLLNMRNIAKKYNGLFDVSYTDGEFTVNAALKLA